MNEGTGPWTAAPEDKVFEIYIKTTPERLWEAITDPRDEGQVQLRGRNQLGLDDRLELQVRQPRRNSRSPRARTWRSIRRADWCRASTRSGATR